MHLCLQHHLAYSIAMPAPSLSCEARDLMKVRRPRTLLAGHPLLPACLQNHSLNGCWSSDQKIFEQSLVQRFSVFATVTHCGFATFVAGRAPSATKPRCKLAASMLALTLILSDSCVHLKALQAYVLYLRTAVGRTACNIACVLGALARCAGASARVHHRCTVQALPDVVLAVKIFEDSCAAKVGTTVPRNGACHVVASA